MSTTTPETQSEFAQKLAGKYLTFRLDKEEYALQILKVQEIIQMQQVTVVPKTPPWIRGVLNLRGKVIPVVDLRTKFGLASSEDTEKTCIVVVQIESDGDAVTMGVIIDEVREVTDINESQIERPPSFGNDNETDFIMGIGKFEKSVKMLLDIDRILSAAEIVGISSLVKE